MIKHTLATLLMALSALLCAAQSAAGWYKYPVYTEHIDNIVATGGKVYYLSGGNLFSFDQADGEHYSYSSINKLSDYKIQDIVYNPEGRYLAVVYDNCNIDLVYDDGYVKNLPEIKDAQVSVTKRINALAFGRGRMAVATTFGIVIYDDKRLEVKESGIYNVNIENIAILGDYLLLYYRQDGGGRAIFQSPLSERHNSLDKFTFVGGIFVSEILPVDDKVFLAKDAATGQLLMRWVDFAGSRFIQGKTYDYVSQMPLRHSPGGVFTHTADQLLFYRDGEFEAKPIPEPLRGQKLAIDDSETEIWAADPQGISLYDVSGSTPTALYDKMLPGDALTCTQVGYMRWSPDGERLYVSNIEASAYKSYALGEGRDSYQTTNIIERGFPRDASLLRATADHTYAQRYQQQHANTRMYGDPNWMVEDPDNPDIYYIGNNHEGVYVAKRDPQTGEYDEIGKFTHLNSPISEQWGGSSRVQTVEIDPQGNLWVGYIGGSHFAVLPAEKRRQDPKQVKTSDWREYKKLASIDMDQKEMQLLFCRRSNMAFIVSGIYEFGIVAIDTKGTYDNPGDDNVLRWIQFTDQDGNTFKFTRTTFVLEDDRGCVWVGTNAGVFEITNPTAATNPSMTVRRIKVPRNDGTNYADYLLDSDQINWMALDPSGRKWIATENSGIFLVSKTGEEIIRNYTKDNSPLPTNVVCSIECSPVDNTVYVGTPQGFFSFLSDSSPAREDYSEIYAYPNPVRPEYGGDVTITGLMDNTIVKIADSGGNVVAEMRSEGGMAQWNVCNAQGRRVRSGVYYVHATSNDGSKSYGAVAKILVIN